MSHLMVLLLFHAHFIIDPFSNQKDSLIQALIHNRMDWQLGFMVH